MSDLFNKDYTEELPQIDARSAFNRINRRFLRTNLAAICPELAAFGRNLYYTQARQFVVGEIEIISSEGTDQGCPYLMPAFTLGILPILQLLIEISLMK